MGGYIPIKCPNCSANLPAQKTNETIYCEYCGTPYYRSSTKVETPSRPVNNDPFQSQPNRYTPPPPPPPTPIPRTTTPTVVPPRPRFSLLLFLILFTFYFVPGIIYFMHITSRQKEWDKKYGGRK